MIRRSAPPSPIPWTATTSRPSRWHPRPGEVVEALASRQYGMVSRAQLLEANVSPGTVRSWLRSGRLRRVHRGVYSTTSLEIEHAMEMAALLACGPHAYLGCRSAAAIRGIMRPPENLVEVVVTKGRVASRPGIRVRNLELRPDEVTTWERLRTTTPARTLYDLARVLPGRELEQAVEEAFALRIVDLPVIRAVLAGRESAPGAARLRRLVEGDRLPLVTRSEAEKLFLDLLRRARLARPRTNVPIVGFRVDFFWPDERVVVEVDGRAFHSSPRRFESDRRRDATLLAAGIRVLRVTWKQLTTEPEAVVADLSRILAAARFPPFPPG